MFEMNRSQTRPAQWSDVAAIVALRNASSQNTRGSDVTAIHWQKRHWYDPNLELNSDTQLSLEGDKILAYVELSSESPFILHEMVGAGHPEYRGLGLGAKLMAWAAEDRCQQNFKTAPQDAAIFIQNSIFDRNHPGQELLANQGFNVVRDFVYPQIEMKTSPPKPNWPAGIEVRPLQTTDWPKVGPALSEAFRDHWGPIAYPSDASEESKDDQQPDHRENDPDAFDPAYFNFPGLVFGAWDGDQVAGSCLCNAKTVEFPEAGYTGSLSGADEAWDWP